MNNMAEKKKNHILLFRNIIWALVIFVLCAIPGKDIPNPHWVFPHIDKIVHFQKLLFKILTHAASARQLNDRQTASS